MATGSLLSKFVWNDDYSPILDVHSLGLLEITNSNVGLLFGAASTSTITSSVSNVKLDFLRLTTESTGYLLAYANTAPASDLNVSFTITLNFNTTWAVKIKQSDTVLASDINSNFIDNTPGNRTVSFNLSFTIPKNVNMSDMLSCTSLKVSIANGLVTRCFKYQENSTTKYAFAEKVKENVTVEDESKLKIEKYAQMDQNRSTYQGILPGYRIQGTNVNGIISSYGDNKKSYEEDSGFRYNESIIESDQAPKDWHLVPHPHFFTMASSNLITDSLSSDDDYYYLHLVINTTDRLFRMKKDSKYRIEKIFYNLKPTSIHYDFYAPAYDSSSLLTFVLQDGHLLETYEFSSSMATLSYSNGENIWSNLEESSSFLNLYSISLESSQTLSATATNNALQYTQRRSGIATIHKKHLNLCDELYSFTLAGRTMLEDKIDKLNLNKVDLKDTIAQVGSSNYYVNELTVPSGISWYMGGNYSGSLIDTGSSTGFHDSQYGFLNGSFGYYYTSILSGLNADPNTLSDKLNNYDYYYMVPRGLGDIKYFTIYGTNSVIRMRREDSTSSYNKLYFMFDSGDDRGTPAYIGIKQDSTTQAYYVYQYAIFADLVEVSIDYGDWTVYNGANFTDI